MNSKILILLSILTLICTNANALSPGDPTVLITGSNHGIGLELSRQYADKGWNVIATVRRPPGDPGLAELNKIIAKHSDRVVIERIDVTKTEMIVAVAEKYKNHPIDVLINNAANVQPTFADDLEIVSQTYDKIDFDRARLDFDVNALGPMRMVQAFMPSVMKSKHKKIINVTSLAASLVNPMDGPGAMNYGASKAALNKYSQLLSVAVKDEGVIVGLFQPIFVASKDDLQGDNEENRETLSNIVSNADGADGAQDGNIQVEIAKFIKEVDELTMKSTGIITNFTTGQIDPF